MAVPKQEGGHPPPGTPPPLQTSSPAQKLFLTPLTRGGALGSKLRVSPVGPPHGPLPMRTQPFSHAGQAVWCPLKNFSNFDFCRNPSVAPRMGLGTHLVTVRVLEHP